MDKEGYKKKYPVEGILEQLQKEEDSFQPAPGEEMTHVAGVSFVDEVGLSLGGMCLFFARPLPAPFVAVASSCRMLAGASSCHVLVVARLCSSSLAFDCFAFMYVPRATLWFLG